jgi:hypothetical protein
MVVRMLSMTCAVALFAGCAERPEQVVPAAGAGVSPRLQTIVQNYSAQFAIPASATTLAATGIAHWGAIVFADSSLTIVGIRSTGQEVWRARAIPNADGSVSLLTTNYTLQIYPDGHFLKALKAGADTSGIAARMSADMRALGIGGVTPVNRSSVRHTRDAAGCETAIEGLVLAFLAILASGGVAAVIGANLAAVLALRSIALNCGNGPSSLFPDTTPPLGDEVHCYLDHVEVACNELRAQP